MASAQVLKKLKNLEAGKKKLEEFRQKKAAEKARKTVSTNPSQSSDDVQNGKRTIESDNVRLTDSNGIGTSDLQAEIPVEHLNMPNVVTKDSNISVRSDLSSLDSRGYKPSVLTGNNISSSAVENFFLNDEEYNGGTASLGLDELKSAENEFVVRNADDGLFNQVAASVGDNFFQAHQISSNQENNASSLPRYHGPYNSSSKKTEETLKDIPSDTSSLSAISVSNDLSRNSFRNLLLNDSGSKNEDNNLLSSPYPGQKFFSLSDVREKRFSGASDHIAITNHSSSWMSGNRISNFNSEDRSYSNHAHTSPPAVGKRSSPLFLDSIETSTSTSPPFPLFAAGKADASVLMVNPMDNSESSTSQINSISNGEADYFHRRQNEDFAALEQHIEDLTQEKFSLQRALEASRVLVDSLASENSTLTESFNQQGSVVDQLKLELEKLQGEIKVQMVEFEAIKEAYVNAQMECSAADERAKLLASEVIGLEEKSLRLRSNELKLERELENSQAEVSHFRKKMSSIEKDREDLVSTINALQEEKKLMQAKLRKASSGGKSIDFDKTAVLKKDAATSTENLDASDSEASRTDSRIEDSFGSHERDNLGHENLPIDHRRMISNINTLISELALEKDELMQSLSAESSRSSKLMELNRELSRKLEFQTQRLELLTAQSLAGDSIIQLKQPDHHRRSVYENKSVVYADEGDEVVERVLGWIIRLFPGGASTRRSSM